MRSNEINEDGFSALWPTHFLQRQLPNSAPANGALLSYILQQEDSYNADDHKEDLTSNYLAQDILSVDNPVIGWLKQCINKTVADYLRHCGLDYDVKWNLQAWSNINRRGDYHNVHNHPHSYLSGTYYVAIPSAQQYDRSARADLNPGAISFFDPRAQANMLAVRNDAQVEAEHRVIPTAGMLLLWPSFLHHFVHPNASDELRVSISFNVVLKWRDEYLP